MRQLLSLLVVGLSFAPLTAQAQSPAKAPASQPSTKGSATKTPETKPDPAEEKESASTAGMGSSEGNRVGKIASIVAEGGFSVAPFPMTGAAAGWYASKDLLAELAYTQGGLALGIVNIKISLVELRAKYFIGNSFYVNGGIGQRSIKFDASLDSKIVGAPSISADAEAKTTGLSFGLGNRWQWSYFSMGCDWLGYFAALSSSGSKVDVPGAADKDTKDLKDSVDKLGKTSSYQLLRFYMGVSF